MPTPADRYLEDAGFLASSLRPETTGVDGTVIWLFAGEFTRDEAHYGPRIQVAIAEKLKIDGLADSITVTIATPPDVLGNLPGEVTKQLIEFIEKNRDVLLRHWRNEIDTGSLVKRLARVSHEL